MAIWIPDLTGRGGPKYRRILDALTEDIVTGALAPGAQLPPHRELAYRLGVSANTASRAYAEAVDRALLRGEVGRGTFVRAVGEPTEPSSPGSLLRPVAGPIDFSRNLPSPGLAAAALATTLAALGASPDLAAIVDYQLDGELSHHKAAGIAWLALTGVAANPSETVITVGAQQGLLAALMAATQPGDLLLTEALFYAPVRTMAARLGLKQAPVAIDDEGLCPDALDAICQKSKARALYLTPTLHAPTTATMSAERRDAVAEVAARHGLIVIEDDVYGPLRPGTPAPIATRLPEAAIYVASTSKCLGPGLRVGFVRAPEPLARAVQGAVSLSCWMPPPLMVEIAARWIADGTARRLTETQRRVTRRRHGIAQALLGDRGLVADPSGLHAWLRLPGGWTGDSFRAEAALRGVRVVDSSAFAAAGVRPEPAVRLCLTHEADESRLRQGLETLRDILDVEPAEAPLVL